jgi:RNA polymerase sigma factor (sigma-70 family)
MLEDRLLVWKFNRGDTDALHRIYEKYKNDLLKVATALLNDKNGIEDVVHDVFASFAQTVGNFQLSGSLKGYLSICIANRARDKNRAIQRQRTVSMDKAEPIRPVQNRPDESAMRDELSRQLD